MSNDIYDFEAYNARGQQVVYDDGTGVDWATCSGVYPTLPGSILGVNIILAGTPGGPGPYALVSVRHSIPIVTDFLMIYGVIENALGSPGNDRITGDLLGNILSGDAMDQPGGDDTISGGSGDDTIYGAGASDTVSGGIGNDSVYGDYDPTTQGGGILAPGSDWVIGNDGNDTLFGGDGVNTLEGGAGYDYADYSGFFDDFGNFTFQIFTVLETGLLTVTRHDSISGDDLVVASDELTGIEGLIGTAGADRIEGRHTFAPGDFTSQTFYGGLGNDTLYGGPGADALFGGDGNDFLWDFDNFIPSGGVDLLNGGAGDDYYALTAPGGVILEMAGGGIDRVVVAFSYVLPPWVEAMVLHSAYLSALNGTGNMLDNSIEGNALGNILAGLAGADYLPGNGGADTLYGGGGADVLDGGTENDVIFGGTEADLLTGQAGNDRIEGGAGADTVSGGAGWDQLFGGLEDDVLWGGAQNDGLNGGGGRDRLSGGTGADRFVFTSAAETGNGAARDVIMDFATGVDQINLSKIAAGQSFIGGAFFHRVAGEVRYDAARGLLSGDLDGDRVADYQISLTGAPVLVAGDLIL